MTAMIDYLVEFASYWWFRYLMVTELYMCEKWERVTIHVIFMVLFCVFWYFNYSILLSLTGLIAPSADIADIMPSVQGQTLKVT